jgi:glyceraldehyde 3-phosphate dehydrogenase
MMIKAFVNGMGRIGHIAFVYAVEAGCFDIKGVNDPAALDKKTGKANASSIVAAINHDSVHKKLMLGHYAEVSPKDPGSFVFDGKEYKVYTEMDANNLPYKALGVDLVLECSGHYDSAEKAQAHINAGAKGVIINSPSKDEMKTVVFGVNEGDISEDDKFVSGASCTTNCLAPVMAAFKKKFDVVFADMLTVHAFTPSQNAVDGVSKKAGDGRIARSVENNIIPTTTGAAKAIGLVIPDLLGKMDGYAVRVPVSDGAYISVDVVVRGEPSVKEINSQIKSCVSDTLGYIEDPYLVSQDIIDMKFGSLFDGLLTKAYPIKELGCSLVRLCAWYDNEASYTRQYVRTAAYYGNLISK